MDLFVKYWGLALPFFIITTMMFALGIYCIVKANMNKKNK